MHSLPYQLIHAVLESAPDAMLMVDADGAIRFANGQVTALFGYSREELIGRSVEMLLPERMRATHSAHRIDFARVDRRRAMGSGLDLRGRRADGSEMPLEISLNPVHCEPEPFVIAALRDITGHLTIQQELKDARTQAEHANLAKGRFLATASHDLRQPLQTIGLLAGALRQLPSTDSEALGLIDSIDASVRTMSRLLNALLDVSKLESGRIRPNIDDFAVQPLLKALQAEFSRAAQQKGLELIVEGSDECARSDALQVGQIVRNLVANAIKYTRAGRVTMRCSAQADGVRIEVSDTGIGMPEEQLAYIFDEFYQIGVEPQASREGYGLGLAIVERLVKLLGLRIEVQSKVGAGSTFAVFVPRGIAAASAEPDRRRASAPVPRGAKQQILLIEDDAAVRHATLTLLQSAGYQVNAVASADEALQQAEGNPRVDVIVSDFHLGGGATGADAINGVRARLGQPTKAILITGDTSFSSSGSRLAVPDPVRFARKPLSAEELFGLLDELASS